MKWTWFPCSAGSSIGDASGKVWIIFSDSLTPAIILDFQKTV
jgi:hypothetical protein